MLEFFNSVLGILEGIYYYFSGAILGLAQLFKVWVGALNSNGTILQSLNLLPNMFIALATLIVTLRIIFALVHGGK